MNATSGTSSSRSPASPVRAVCAWALLLAASGPASAQSILSIHDEATGATRVFTPGDSRFSLSGDGRGLNVAAEGPGGGWYLRFEAPEGQFLAPGRYDQAGCRFPLRMGRAPGLEVTDNNPACSYGLGADTLWGSFAIRQIAYDTAGKVTSLEALFTQRKGAPTAPALAGLVRYEARPLSLTLKSGAGFALGAIAQENHGDSGIFALEGTVSDGIHYSASVRKDTWRILIDPPTGRQLQVGRYTTRAFAGASHAGLLIVRGVGQPWRCADAEEGVLDIQAIRVNPAGTILGLRASFEYRCGGTRPALRGRIRFLE